MAKTSDQGSRARAMPAGDRLHRTSSRKGKIRQENYDKILAAAETVFAERGLEGATTALIAKKAGIAKANLHYYFATKLDLYKEVTSSILDLWLNAFDTINLDDDPHAALTQYIRSKIDLSRKRPMASRVFANEIIRGAPVIRRFLSNELRAWVREKTDILDRWARLGKMEVLENPEHLFFIIWAATQTYADFSSQMCQVLGKKKLDDSDYEAGARMISRLVLAGCGINVAGITQETALVQAKNFRSRKLKSGIG